ncbi:hypothetical protein [Microvirga lenta]|uniref:hypothetical protein n=1 Tax=Microvirga lenta TaxID=2881337 RepID=UPI001CFFC43E|nr:hypothetical protein [Microvirga lenta]MCB5176769.1 hypothetical protein [Microvirga lenta]
MADVYVTIQEALRGRFNDGDTVIVSDTVTNFNALTVGEIESLSDYRVDHLQVVSDETGNVSHWTVNQAKALLGTAITFTPGSRVFISDEGENIAGLSAEQITLLGRNGKNIRCLDAVDDEITLSAAQILATQGLNETLDGISEDDAVTLRDTGRNITELEDAQLSALDDKGVVAIDVIGDAIGLTLAQVNSIDEAVAFAAADEVSISGTAAELAGISSTMLQSYASRGIDRLHATDAVNLTASQAATLVSGGMGYTAGSNVTVSGSIGDFTAAQIAALGAKGVDMFDAAAPVVLNAGKAAALAGTDAVLAADDNVTVRDTGANLASLSGAQIAALKAKGVDGFEASDNAVTLSVSQIEALGGALSQGGSTVAVADTGAAIAALTPAQIGALAAQGVGSVDATDNSLALSLAQFGALGTVTLSAADSLVLADAGAQISGLTPAQIAEFAAKGVDALDASDNAITLSIAQFAAMGAFQFAAGDRIKVNGTSKGDKITGRASDEILVGLSGNDRLKGSAGDDLIWGGKGKDMLYGVTGRDVFVFDTKARKKDADRIKDFKVKDDTIFLDNKILKKLGKKGSLDKPAKLKKTFF